MRAAGDGGLLLDAGSLAAAQAWHLALERELRAGSLEALEIIPGARTVLIVGAGPGARAVVEACRPDNGGLGGVRGAGEHPGNRTVIPVVYDGADLAEVADITGLSVEEIVRRHTAPDYTVAFTGFAPGFAYLSGGDPQLDVPRRSTPRARIPAGAVGLAGEFSGIYPRASPGGWQLIGRTEHRMWDLDRPQPAALLPGARVSFVAERATARTRTDTPAAAGHSAQADPSTTSGPSAPADPPVRAESPARAKSPESLAVRPALLVSEPGLQTLVQDAGRPGHGALGVSASGASDRGAYRRANHLVGNRPCDAVLELRLGGFVAEALTTSVAALTGAPRTATVTGPEGMRRIAHGVPFRLSEGETLELSEALSGTVTTLALRGGIAAPLVLGSASRDTLALIGPRALERGDTVAVTTGPAARAVAEPLNPEPELPEAGETRELLITPGPRDDWFGPDGLRSLVSQEWEVSLKSDRVGARLSGEPLVREPDWQEQELPSEGLVIGAIQIPPDGQPVLFLADHPVTGGYPVIGVVVAEHLDLAAQLPAGARVRFVLAEHPRHTGDAR